MSKWDGAFGQIRRRSLDSIVDGLDVASPFSFKAKDDRSDVPDFLDTAWQDLGNEVNSFLSLPGRDVNFVRDTLICAAKYLHVVESVKRNVHHGSMTWAMVDAYHAALLGTRLFGAVYGVLSYSVRGRTVLVDFRPDLGSPDDVKAFKKATKDIKDPIRVLRPQPKFLEQADAWALVIRLCSIARPRAEDLATLEAIKGLAGKKVSAFRNGILYDSVAWEWLDDFDPVSTAIGIQHGRLADDEANQALTLQVLSVMFGYMRDSLAAICSKVGFNLTSLSSLVGTQATPVALLG